MIPTKKRCGWETSGKEAGKKSVGSRKAATLVGGDSRERAPVAGSVTLQGNAHTPPEFQYSHSPRSLNRGAGGLIDSYNEEAGGNSITGGHIYRGTELGPSFLGLYIGANLGHHAGSAVRLPRLFYGDPDDAAVDLFKFEFDEASQQFDDSFLDEEDFVPGFDFEAAGLTPGKFDLPQLVLSIAEDNSGELYVVGVDFAGLGTISKIVPANDYLPGDVDGVNGVNLDDFEIHPSKLLHVGNATRARGFNVRWICRLR